MKKKVIKTDGLTMTFVKTPFKFKVNWFKNMFFLRLILFIRKITNRQQTFFERFIIKHFLYNNERYISINYHTTSSIFYPEITDFQGDYVDRALFHIKISRENKMRNKEYNRWCEDKRRIMTEEMSKRYFKEYKDK